MKLRKRRVTVRKAGYQRMRPNSKRHYEGAALVSIPESSRITGFGVSLSYQKARAGTLPGAVRIDGRWYVHTGRLYEWLDSLADGANAA